MSRGKRNWDKIGLILLGGGVAVALGYMLVGSIGVVRLIFPERYIPNVSGTNPIESDEYVFPGDVVYLEFRSGQTSLEGLPLLEGGTISTPGYELEEVSMAPRRRSDPIEFINASSVRSIRGMLSFRLPLDDDLWGKSLEIQYAAAMSSAVRTSTPAAFEWRRGAPLSGEAVVRVGTRVQHAEIQRAMAMLYAVFTVLWLPVVVVLFRTEWWYSRLTGKSAKS